MSGCMGGYSPEDSMRKRKEIVIGGLGNLLMTDEGIGICVVRESMVRAKHFPEVDFVELGSSVIGVVHAIAGRRKAILIDCVWMGEPAGTIRRFSPDEVVSTKAMAHFSLHEGDVLGALELSRKLGEYPEEVAIFGIQPESIVLGDSLSSTLRERLDNYVEMILRELNGDYDA
ncbi:hydrogenase maturation protease [Chloroflexota bacterium]